MPEPQATPRSPLAVIAVLLVAAGIGFLGIEALATAEWFGYTKQGRPVHITGAPARWFGAMLCTVAMLPLTLLLRRRAVAARWAWALGGVGAMFLVAMLLAVRAEGG